MVRLFAILLLMVLPAAAFAEKRLGLIIGNDAYADVPALQKAVADAEAVAAQLASVGFETILATDIDRRGMNRAIADFTGRLQPGDTAFLFFAGHGVEIDGENYLLPTDIVAPEVGGKDFVAGESIALSDLLDRIRRTGARTTITILDACRNNPFETVTGRSIGRSRGLGRIAAPEGTFVVFSAGTGQLALDGLNETDAEPNSVFTRLLLPKLAEPGLELRELVSDLRVEVRDLARTSNHAQLPAYYDELLGDFYFKTARGLEPVVGDTGGATSQIRADFALASDIGSAAALQAFLDQYGREDDFTVSLARRMLADHGGATNGEEVAAPAPLPEDTQPATPEAARANRKAIIRASQEELNRLGCNAGGADGVSGPRTRTAFARFIDGTASALVATDLGSQRALDVLKSTAAPACEGAVAAATSEPVPTAAAEAVSIAGTWRFNASCPLWIKTHGTTVYRRTGPGRYTGTVQDNVGNVGTITARLSGTTLTTIIVFNGSLNISETYTVASDGRSMTGAASQGCTLRAVKS